MPSRKSHSAWYHGRHGPHLVLKALAEVRGSTTVAEVAIVWDWNARWAVELPGGPSGELRFEDQVRPGTSRCRSWIPSFTFLRAPLGSIV